MSELFAGLANQYPDVRRFRDEVLGGRLLLPDEAYGLLASYAARAFPLRWYRDWGIPVVGHTSEILEYDTGLGRDEIDHRLKIRVDPPGITKKVRYADPRRMPYPERRRYRTRCVVRSNAVILPITGLPIEAHGNHVYPSWLWPGSVVDKLYDLSEELGEAFDWPVSATDTLGRTRNEAAAWFVLTGEAPEVRPLDARWKPKQSSAYLNPQWRVQFIIPPWVPADEVSKAYRLMQRQILEGRNRLREPKAFEVARFVWEQERLNGYERPKWRVLLEQWNEAHPDNKFENHRHFHEYCMRGVKAVTELNFSWFPPKESSSDE